VGFGVGGSRWSRVGSPPTSWVSTIPYGTTSVPSAVPIIRPIPMSTSTSTS